MEDFSHLQIALERDFFLRSLIRELAGTLEDVVGLEQASGFLSVVGQAIGEQLNEQYRTALGVTGLNAEQVTGVLLDLKKRIQGDFYLIEANSEKCVLGARQCPFEGMVVDRKSLCMMTSNVFGTIVAENLGYARVNLESTIAERHPECRVAVHFNPGPDVRSSEGREYFKTPDETPP